MAKEKRVVYTYTGQPKRKYGICDLELSKFTITEGEEPPHDIPYTYKITRFTVDYMRRHDTTATVKHHMEIIPQSSANPVQSSSLDLISEKNAWNSIQHTLSDGIPPWALDLTTRIRLVPDNNVNDVAWIASSNYPITITVLYATSIYEPSISDATVYRSTANGIKDDTGTYLSYSANVKAGSVGSGSSGRLTLWQYESKPTSTSYGTMVGRHTVATSTSSTTISNSGAKSFSLTDSGYFRFELLYREESEPYYTETVESPVIYVPRSFVNVHLAGTEGGGVCLGGYSSADASTPKFESHYPAYFYGGIAQIGGSSLWESLTPASANIISGGTYGDMLKMRKIENKCIIKGSVMIKPESASIAIAELPIGCKPIKTTFRLAACQGARIARIAVHGDDGSLPGNLVLEWVRNLSDGDLYTSAAIWVDCSIEYWID